MRWALVSLPALLHTDQPLSLSERRPLAQRPEVSVQALASGNYMSEFETYALDQFPLREAMRQLKAQDSVLSAAPERQ